MGLETKESIQAMVDELVADYTSENSANRDKRDREEILRDAMLIADECQRLRNDNRLLQIEINRMQNGTISQQRGY